MPPPASIRAAIVQCCARAASYRLPGMLAASASAHGRAALTQIGVVAVGRAGPAVT